MDVGPSYKAAELAARDSFGRLVSYFAWQWRDVGAAQDALGDALLKALEEWPISGVPNSPEAWLVTVAKRRLLHMARHERVKHDPAIIALLEQEEFTTSAPIVPDARLKLMFVCAHPAIDEKIRIPLILQTVLGLQVVEMAPAMMLSPTTLAQRLVRAKQKIRDAGIRFEEPEKSELSGRLSVVLESIYGAFGLSLDAVDGAETRIIDLQEEAIYLCNIICNLLPKEPEAQGLRALMSFCRARRHARVGEGGNFIPLNNQDTALWDKQAIIQADQWLWQAAQLRRPGPFQLEAAVQSAHCHRLFIGKTPWNAIHLLYKQINEHFPTQGSLVAGAVAMGEAGDVDAGLQQLDRMEKSVMKTFQPWWVARGHLLRLSKSATHQSAAEAFQIAIGLSSQQNVKNYLESRQKSLLLVQESSAGQIE